MTPSGHAGASIVVAYVIERCVFKSEVTPITLGLSALVGLLPDLDGLITIALKRSRPLGNKLRHHEFLTHTPLFYLLLTLALWGIASPQVSVLFGMLSLGHLFLDSWGTDDGIMWLWPLSRRQFGLFPRNLHAGGAYGLRFYRRHVRCARVFVPEVLLLVSGSLLALHTLGRG
jgi:hypothetical protein